MLFCINRSTPNLLRIYNPQQCPITHSIRQVNTYSEIIMFDHLEIYFCTINKFCAVQMFVIFVTNIWIPKNFASASGMHKSHLFYKEKTFPEYLFCY